MGERITAIGHVSVELEFDVLLQRGYDEDAIKRVVFDYLNSCGLDGALEAVNAEVDSMHICTGGVELSVEEQP
jgi:hypothetical protein